MPKICSKLAFMSEGKLKWDFIIFSTCFHAIVIIVSDNDSFVTKVWQLLLMKLQWFPFAMASFISYVKWFFFNVVLHAMPTWLNYGPVKLFNWCVCVCVCLRVAGLCWNWNMGQFILFYKAVTSKQGQGLVWDKDIVFIYQ